MTEQERIWFEELVADRTEFVRVLKRPCGRGYAMEESDKYSESAHFIYELIQNADDVKASYAFFDLREEGLYFRHNGSEHFTISNPKNEEEDGNNGRLGHLNAILSSGNSSKRSEVETIGKFGVGFRAVYLYTKTPHIYDKKMQFLIRDRFVPELLKHDIREDKDETVFYFPFDTDKPQEQAYEEILSRLQNLEQPVLFPNHIQRVEWQAGEEHGSYNKNIVAEESAGYGDSPITVQDIVMSHEANGEEESERMWMFTRTTEYECRTLRYSVGFSCQDGQLAKSAYANYFCFFPTKQQTHFGFVVNAPFLLNSSRENIKEYEDWNIKLHGLLGSLAADSLLVLRDKNLIKDDIFNIIPTCSQGDPQNHYYEAIKKVFLKEEIIPTITGDYTSKRNAYWYEDRSVLALFSEEQLQQFTKQSSARWVFPNVPRNKVPANYYGGGKRDYMDECTCRQYNLAELFGQFRLVGENFMEQQPLDWYYELYKTLKNSPTYWNILKYAPIFKDNKGNVVAAYAKQDKTDQRTLFLPYDDGECSQEYPIISQELLDNADEDAKYFIRTTANLKAPERKDEIFSKIIPQLRKGNVTHETAKSAFSKIFTYYLSLQDENSRNELYENLKDIAFLCCKSSDGEDSIRKVSETYSPTDDLQTYFTDCADVWFVDSEQYEGMLREAPKNREHFECFLQKMGIKTHPSVKWDSKPDYDNYENLRAEKKHKFPYSKYRYDVRKYWVEGLKSSFHRLMDFGDDELEEKKRLSSVIFRFVVEICACKERFERCFENECHYFYRSSKIYRYPSEDCDLLKEKRWIWSKTDSRFVSPNEITLKDLEYELQEHINSKLPLQSQLFHRFSDFFGFKPIVTIREKFREWASTASDEDLEEWMRRIYEKEQQADSEISNIIVEVVDSLKYSGKSRIRRTTQKKETGDSGSSRPTENAEEQAVDDEIDLSDYEKEVNRHLENLKEDLKARNERKRLEESITREKKYSYLWFECQLRLLSTYSKPNSQGQKKSKSILFSTIRPYTDQGKTFDKFFVLAGSNSYIQSSIEDATDVRLQLRMRNGETRTVEIDSSSKKGQELVVHCQKETLANVNLHNVTQVQMTFTPEIDLLQRLTKAFLDERNIDKWTDINEVFPPVQFIFGPPGTGKTQKVSEKIIGMLKKNPKSSILVLTPTNKAGDVICQRIYDKDETISICRLGSATSPDLPEALYRNVIERDTMPSVVISTIHRLPYFSVQAEGEDGRFSYELFKHRHFDLVVFDEASMISLPYITFAVMSLRKTYPETAFVVAGDPKQIPPVAEVSDGELESSELLSDSIYDMMNLHSFVPEEQKSAMREMDEVVNLPVQYRSVESIGQLFNELSYSGRLEHGRKAGQSTKSPASRDLPQGWKQILTAPTTFIDIPVIEDDAVFRVEKLNYSSYHVYSAILVSEIVRYMDATNASGEEWSVGIIAPYKAQAVLVNKIIASYDISPRIRVIADTVHGFQGDQCDIVFFICNPNGYVYSRDPRCLLQKEYIYNVAISRAEDYLVVLHPLSVIQNPYIGKIQESYKQFGSTAPLQSGAIERVIFGDASYIERNTFITGHDSVNVFRKSSMKYILKASDTAIDVQIND